jgi:hypothetical protein
METAGTNNNKLEALTHYIIARTFKHELGATKLNKVLWLADLIAWRERATSLTGLDTYKRMPHGPVPYQINEVLSRLQSIQAIAEVRSPLPVGYRREFASLVDPDLGLFSARDIDIIHIAIDYITPKTAADVSEQTHDAYWDEVPQNGELSVAAASLWFNSPTQDDMNWAKSELQGEDL